MSGRVSIFQLVAGYREGDAISNCANVMRGCFRAWGNRSEIICNPRNAAPSVRDQILALDKAGEAIRPDDVVILHLSTGSDINLIFPQLPGRKVILYHNVTPHHYFKHCNPSLSEELRRGRRQVASLAAIAELNLADSAYNAAELVEMGFKDVKIFPLAIDIDDYAPGRSDAGMREKLSDGTFNILFVGRCAPNKKIEDLISITSFVQRNIEPNTRLVHAGSYAGTEVYRTLLLAQARELGMDNLMMLGAVTQAELNACYATAHVFLCMSEHEGFCAPLIEAMLHDIPVLARAAAAVPETMDGAGILFREVDPPLIAETLSRVLRDSNLRKSVVERQRKRLRSFRERDIGGELRALLRPVMKNR